MAIVDSVRVWVKALDLPDIVQIIKTYKGQVERVQALHARQTMRWSSEGEMTQERCGYCLELWPCRTIQAMEGE